MPDFANVGSAAVDVYKPAGDADSLSVEPGQTITVAGDVTQELDDAYIVGEGDDARAWPKARWELKPPPKSSTKKTDGKSADANTSEGTD